LRISGSSSTTRMRWAVELIGPGEKECRFSLLF
jgi:hypothetical protein